MAGALRIVDVETQREVSRATLADDGTITYDGGESAEGVIRQRARLDGSTPAEAYAVLARDGWSNGYLMVALDSYPRNV